MTVKGYEITPRADLREANLTGANLWGFDLRRADLRGADLTGANLTGANLWGVDLRRADLTGANLWGVDLRRADLRGADLRGANLWGADLTGASLWGANLWGVDLRRADLRRVVGDGKRIVSAHGRHALVILDAETVWVGCARMTLDEFRAGDDRPDCYSDDQWAEFQAAHADLVALVDTLLRLHPRLGEGKPAPKTSEEVTA